MSTTPQHSEPPLPPLRRVTGVILAGGRSTRYGTNKALADLDGVPLIERVTRVMGSVFAHVILITNTPQDFAHLRLPMTGDLVKGIGPLGGIYTGLKSIPEEAGFFVACDMPFLQASLMRRIVELRSDWDAVVPRVGWMIEPLHAIYTKTCLGPMEQMIQSGDHLIRDLFPRIRMRYVDAEILRALDPELRCFRNVNRPEDLSAIREKE